MDLEVTFAGVCLSVPNRGWAANPSAICVLLADATDPRGGTALDGMSLPRHTGMLRVPLRNLGHHGLAADDEVVHYLKRKRVSFDVYPKPAFSVDLTPLPPSRQIDPGDPSEKSFLWALDFAEVIPGRAHPDPKALLRIGASDKVLAQVFVDGGHLETDLLPPGIWTCKPELAGSRARDQRIAHRACVRMRNLTSANIVLTDMDDPSKRQSLPLDPSAGVARVQISNMCDDNPFEWPRPANAVVDIDTKWIYGLLAPTGLEGLVDETIKLMSQPSLPVPHPVGLGDSGPNCIGARCEAASFFF